jgi:polysaccharide deacetylase 2 family uncharacterized protein YibQ
MNFTLPARDDIINAFSLRQFLFGLGGVGVLLLLVIGWIALSGTQADRIYAQLLPSQTLLISMNAAQTTQAAATPARASVNPPTRPKTTPLTNLSSTSKALIDNDLPRYSNGLAKTPVDGLVEPVANGLLPIVRRQDKLTSFEAYKRPFTMPMGKAVISLVIEDLGLSDVATESAIRTMPENVTLSFSPYSYGLDKWVGDARENGHEVWLTLPLETSEYPQQDPGPHTILIGHSARENLSKLRWVMSRTQGYVGFIPSYRQIFTTASNDMRPVFGDFYQRGLGYVDNAVRSSSALQSMASGMSAPFGVVDVWLDRDTQSSADIQARFDALENIAKQRGKAIGLLRAFPVSYQETLKWIETLESKNIVLAPLSATITEQ